MADSTQKEHAGLFFILTEASCEEQHRFVSKSSLQMRISDDKQQPVGRKLTETECRKLEATVRTSSKRFARRTESLSWSEPGYGAKRDDASILHSSRPLGCIRPLECFSRVSRSTPFKISLS